MSLQEIKEAVNDGKTVHWSNELYHVMPDQYYDYLIRCSSNGSCIGLTWRDGVTMNGKPEEFFVAKD